MTVRTRRDSLSPLNVIRHRCMSAPATNNRMHWSVRRGRFQMESQLRTPRDAERYPP